MKAGQRLSIYWIALARSCPRDSFAACSHVGRELVDQGSAHGATDREPLLGAPAVDRPLDRKQRVDAAHHLDGDRRSGISFFPEALRRAFSSMSVMAKKGRRVCTQHAASRIGQGLRSAR